MSENKTTKYFKYAIGEILLVVIGILIALSINNWNQNRISNKTLNTYLVNLKQDLLNEQLILNSMIEWHSFKHHSMQYLLKMEGTNLYDPVADEKTNIPHFPPNQDNAWHIGIPDDYDKDFIAYAYSRMHREVMFPFPNSTMEELKSTGMYSAIGLEIKDKLLRYYVNRENDFNGKVQILAMEFQASIAEDGFITSDVAKLDDPISLLKDNPKRIGIVKRMIRESGWTVISAQNANERNKELVQLLEQEIAK